MSHPLARCSFSCKQLESIYKQLKFADKQLELQARGRLTYSKKKIEETVICRLYCSRDYLNLNSDSGLGQSSSSSCVGHVVDAEASRLDIMKEFRRLLLSLINSTPTFLVADFELVQKNVHFPILYFFYILLD